MTPRFLAKSEKGMLLEPRVTEAGREIMEKVSRKKKSHELVGE